MAFTPVNVFEINADFVISGSFTPLMALNKRDFITGIQSVNNLCAWFKADKPIGEIGQGKKPGHRINGIIKESS